MTLHVPVRHVGPSLAVAAIIAAVLVVSSVTGFAGKGSADRSGQKRNSGPPVGAKLIFSDGFDGRGLDAAKWITCYPWASPIGCTNSSTSEQEWYTPEALSISDGALHLTARHEQAIGGQRRYDFTSGMVATAGRFEFTYGYAEFRARLPKGPGLWSALWLLPAARSWPPEIDVAEVLGGDTTSAALTEHPQQGAPHQRHVKTSDLSVGWHIFAVDWQPGSIRWFVDGQPRFGITSDVPSQPMYLVMNLAVGGMQAPDASTQFPASLDVDYVHVWQRD